MPKRKIDHALVRSIEDAAAIIDGMALDMRICSTVPPDHEDWAGDELAKQEYENWKRVVAALYRHADRLKGY